MVSRPTMYSQAGLSMGTRAQQVSQQFGKLVSKEDLRHLYHGRGITRQSVRSSYTAGNIPSQPEQLVGMQRLQAEIGGYVQNDFEIVQIDECTFGANQYSGKHWAHKNEPLVREGKYSHHKYVSVCGAISAQQGKIHFHLYHNQYLKSADLLLFLEGLAEKMGKTPWVIFWDNASIHTSKETKSNLEDLEVDMVLNLTARPDLNGIEMYWAQAKQYYRAAVDHNKVNGIGWDQQELVRRALEQVDDDAARRSAIAGIINIQAGKLVEPASYDRQEQARHRLFAEPEKVMEQLRGALHQP
jgi:transposase